MAKPTAPMPVSRTLRDAARRAREIALHFDRAADELGPDLNTAALDRMEHHCAFGHVKASSLKQAATRALKVIASLRQGHE